MKYARRRQLDRNGDQQDEKRRIMHKIKMGSGMGAEYLQNRRTKCDTNQLGGSLFARTSPEWSYGHSGFNIF
jgi:hypothetical protein